MSDVGLETISSPGGLCGVPLASPRGELVRLSASTLQQVNVFQTKTSGLNFDISMFTWLLFPVRGVDQWEYQLACRTAVFSIYSAHYTLGLSTHSEL